MQDLLDLGQPLLHIAAGAFGETGDAALRRRLDVLQQQIDRTTIIVAQAGTHAFPGLLNWPTTQSDVRRTEVTRTLITFIVPRHTSQHFSELFRYGSNLLRY